MVDSVNSKAFSDVLKNAKIPELKDINIGDSIVKIRTPFPSAEDWRDMIIYFIMIDRFNNPVSEPKYRWNESCDCFQGGTFNGICEKLDYIKSLGFSAIWLTPVFKNCIYDNTYHGYGIQDFMTVDPRFGTEEDLQNLIDQAHARDIYIIFDIVLNHTGEVFKYDAGSGIVSDVPPLLDSPGNILWRDRSGNAKWHELPDNCSKDEGVWPAELQSKYYFFRLGNGAGSDDNSGDFYTMRKLNADYHTDDHYPVRDALIRSYQYAIAKFDPDGFRIDSLKFISSDFAHDFANEIREFAQSIGKKNFFIYGEVYDTEDKIAQYIGKNTQDADGIIGVDAALDFPLFYVLPGVIKGMTAPSEISKVFSNRRRVQENLLSSHGEAGKYFVSFLDNHDQNQRFYHPGFENQLITAVGALITLQGISCLYYGTEQGLSGRGGMDSVREALWGKPNAFDTDNPIFKCIQSIVKVHTREPAVRYGRQYFREVSGDGTNFGISRYRGGILAYSRVLYDEEILVVINTNTTESWTGYVIIDYMLHSGKTDFQILFSNCTTCRSAAAEIRFDAVTHNLDGSTSYGNVRSVLVDLDPMEIIILKG
jgi:glycosidase